MNKGELVESLVQVIESSLSKFNLSMSAEVDKSGKAFIQITDNVDNIRYCVLSKEERDKILAECEKE